MAKVTIGKIDFDAVSFDEAAQKVVDLAKSGAGGTVITPNLAHIFQAEENIGDYCSLLARSSLVLADGMPLIWGAKILGTPLPSKVSGSDLIYRVSEFACQQGEAVFLMGGLEGEAEIAKKNLQALYPGLKIDLYYPPFGFEKNPQENQKIIDAIDRSSAKIVFVGVGSPKQELWADTCRELLPDRVFVGIGISIAYCAGTTSRAPRWMQKSGLEWFYRFLQEPRRLGMRYLKCFMFPLIIYRTWGARKHKIL